MSNLFSNALMLATLVKSVCLGYTIRRDLQSGPFDAKLSHYGSPYYNQAENAIVTSLKCRSSGNVDNCANIEWALAAMPESAVHSGDLLPGGVGKISIDTPNFDCESILVLEVKPNTSKATVPEFQCKVKLKDQDAQKRSPPLRPRLSIKILTENSSFSVRSGNNISLHCPIKNDLPEPAKRAMRVHWWWLNPSQFNVTPLYSAQSLILQIRKVSKSQEGWFQCRPIGDLAYNVRSPINSSWIKLKVVDVLDAPRNVRLEPRGVCGTIVWDRPNVSLGAIEAVELNCSFKAVSLHSPDAFGIKINSSSSEDRCRVLFRSSTRVSNYSEYITVPACRQPDGFHWPKVTWGTIGAGIVCLLVVCLLKKFHIFKSVKILCFRTRRRSIAAKMEERQQESPRNAEGGRASDVKEVKGMTGEVLDILLDDRAPNLTHNAMLNEKKPENESAVEASTLDDGVVKWKWKEEEKESPV